MDSFPVISQNMFCNLAKISHLTDLENDYFSLELAMELYWWHIKCLLRNMLLKIASQDTFRIIMEFPRIFNVNLRLIRPICYLSNHCWHCIQTWWDKLLHYWSIFCNKNISGPEFFKNNHEIWSTYFLCS